MSEPDDIVGVRQEGGGDGTWLTGPGRLTTLCLEKTLTAALRYVSRDTRGTSGTGTLVHPGDWPERTKGQEQWDRLTNK